MKIMRRPFRREMKICTWSGLSSTTTQLLKSNAKVYYAEEKLCFTIISGKLGGFMPAPSPISSVKCLILQVSSLRRARRM